MSNTRRERAHRRQLVRANKAFIPLGLQRRDRELVCELELFALLPHRKSSEREHERGRDDDA